MRLPWSVRALIVLEVLALAWGAVSFGAVYPFGYWPLIVACTAIGLCSFAIVRARSSGLWNVAAACCAVAATIVLQLIPIPNGLLAGWSPARDAFLKRYDVLYALSGSTTSHALSINPSNTGIALSCYAAFTLLLIGTARVLSVRGASRLLVSGVVAVGLALALFALAQNLALADQTGEGHTILIYGFWPDPYVNKPFGPFINKNNYAGWMLMAVPLAIGYCGASLSRLWRSVHPDWRNRLLALSSKDGAYALFAAVATLVMGVSLIVSMSRSGMIALAATAFGFAWFAPGGERRGRGVRFGIAAVALVVLVAWAGADTIRDRFQDRSDASMNGRMIAWENAGRIIADFPVVGTGFNTFGTAMLLYQQGDPINFWEEAHNDYLQIVAEGGIIGAVVVALAIAVVAVEIRRRFREESSSRPSTWLRAGAVAGICAIALQELVEFSLQIPGNAALFAVLVGIALHRSPQLADSRP